MNSELITFLENRFQQDIRSHTLLENRQGAYNEFPEPLDPMLVRVLKNQNIRSLYSHQTEAFYSISNHKDTVIVSRTASGKTLSFLLPILNDYLNTESPFSTLLLYPTKALSRDQEGNLGTLVSAVRKKKKLGTFDGDTPREERARLAKTADFIITNPDMLHSGILPNHNRKWKSFLSRLKYIIIDEVHTYRGSFGSHVSNVFRRLLRICEIHGSKPIFVCSSATVGNPKEHVELLLGRNFTIVDKDGSPRAQRDLYMINPPLMTSHGGTLYRKGPASVSAPLIAKAARLGVRTICFCRARQQVERLHRAVVTMNPDLKDLIKPYRGGFLPNERRKLERDFFQGRTTVIISTNALELGIDIGDLELCILSGHPGSIASFWQQAGRVGRKSGRSVIVYIAKDTAVDQYLVHHPEFVTSAPIEQVWLNPDNPYIFMQHIPCAAYEHPLRENEPVFEPSLYKQTVAILKDEKTVVPYKEFQRYALEDYPSRGVNLRGMTDYNIEIHCFGEVIGELDPIGSRGSLYKDAIYQHLGKKYLSLNLDLEKKLCEVEPINVNYYTEASWEKRIEITDLEDHFTLHGHEVQFGYTHVNKQPKIYKKIKERSFENIGYGPITLPPFEYDTTGFCVRPSKQWQEAVGAKDKRFIGAALYGLSFILKRVGPSLCMSDMSDIDTDVSLSEPKDELWKSAFYLYDTIEGGVGYGEKIYENLETCLKLCLQIINECECRNGCPSCVPPLPAGVDDEELANFMIESNGAVVCTTALISHLISGELIIPDVTIEKQAFQTEIAPQPEDLEAKRTKERLMKAARILKKKRGRQH